MAVSEAWTRISSRQKALPTIRLFPCGTPTGALHPWFNLVHQDVNATSPIRCWPTLTKAWRRCSQSWSFYGNETWCMIGYHAVSVLADMIVKGVKGFDYERAYEAMKKTALNEHYDCLPDYIRNGYIPFDKEAESVSKTLEYAYDDYCIAQAARVLGKEDDYRYFLNRSLSYQTLVDPETKYMRGRDSQGNWRTPFSPIAYQGPGSVNGWGDITEGFTMQYTWTVPHDVQGYINLTGKKLFEKRLDDSLRSTAGRYSGCTRHPGAYRRVLAWKRALPSCCLFI